MDSMNIHEIVTKLVGPINPVGETNADAQRFENLEVAIDLANRLLFDIACVARKGGTGEFSVEKAAKAAKIFLEEVRDGDI